MNFGENKTILSRKLGVASANPVMGDFADMELSLQRGFMAGVAGDYAPRRRVRGRLWVKSEKRDRAKQALPFGKRVSRTGRIYYELRKNRADKGERL